jgi:hypothetical protein
MEGDKALLRVGTENKYEAPCSGPHTILKVHTDGTARLQMGAVTDTVNIRHLTPFRAANSTHRGGECNMWRTSRRARTRRKPTKV